MAKTQALYRFYDEQGELLYVGITMNPAGRWAQHRTSKPWWHEVSDISIEVHKSRDAVLMAERDAIKDENPRYNIVHAEPATIVAAPDRFVWECEVCALPVEDGEGMIGISGDDLNQYREEAELWNLGKPENSLRLQDYPMRAPWRVCHFGVECELALDTYLFVIERVRTPALLLSVTAFLMDKTWLDETNWSTILKHAARGVQ